MTLIKKPFGNTLKMRKCWYPAFFPFFTMFSTPLRDQSHSLIHILFVLCRRFRLMSLKFYCLVIHISHKTLEIGCAWSKRSGERLQGHHGPLVYQFAGPGAIPLPMKNSPGVFQSFIPPYQMAKNLIRPN